MLTEFWRAEDKFPHMLYLIILFFITLYHIRADDHDGSEQHRETCIECSVFHYIACRIATFSSSYLALYILYSQLNSVLHYMLSVLVFVLNSRLNKANHFCTIMCSVLQMKI